MALGDFMAIVVGAATKAQANRTIDENLLNPDRFFSAHPLAQSRGQPRIQQHGCVRPARTH